MNGAGTGGVEAAQARAKRQKHRQMMPEVSDRRAAAAKAKQQQEHCEKRRPHKASKSATGLFDDAFELAESLMHQADKYTNRLENAEYLGSAALTFPNVHRDRDDALEPAEDGARSCGAKDGRGRWEEVAKSRAVGVVAMEHLLERLKKTAKEREEFAGLNADLESKVHKLQRNLVELQADRKRMQEEIAASDTRMQAIERAAEKRSNRQMNEVARLQKTVSGLQTRNRDLGDERDELESKAAAAEADLHDARDRANDLQTVLDQRKQREKDDAAKMAHLLRDNAKIAMECERIQQDMERQAMELEESRIQIQRGKEQYENAVREGQDKLRLLNERLTGQLRNKDAASTEQEAQVEVLTQDLNKARDEVKQAMQRVLDLETELKHAKGSFHDLHQKNDDQQQQILRLKMKNKWAWLITTCVVQEAFPHNTDVEVQTDTKRNTVTLHAIGLKTVPTGCDDTLNPLLNCTVSSVQVSMNTDVPKNEPQASRHWGQVCRQADRKLEDVDRGDLWTVNQLFGFISDTYSKKLIVDATDDKAHQKRQTLPEYFGTLYLEETKSKESATAAEIRLVMNVRHWMRVAVHAKQEQTAPRKDKERKQIGQKGGTESKDREAEILKLVACLPRLKTFARFLALEGEQDGRLQIGHMPLDALNVYLALLVKVRQGRYPLLPDGCERTVVKSKDMLEAIDYVFHRVKTHQRMAIHHLFERDVSGGRQDVDIDNALTWLLERYDRPSLREHACTRTLCAHALVQVFLQVQGMHLFDKVCSERYMDDVFNTADDRLSALFVAHDKDGDGNLDFEEYFGMVKKIRNEQKDSLSHRQLVRLYGDMALSPFVDAPTFVRIARANRLCAFIAGPPMDEVKIDHDRIKKLGAIWSALEPHVKAFGREHADEPVGMRVWQDVSTIRALLREKVHAEQLEHYIRVLQRSLGLEHVVLDFDLEHVGSRAKNGDGAHERVCAESPEPVPDTTLDAPESPQEKVEKSMIKGLDVTLLAASTRPPPYPSFPEVEDGEHGPASSGVDLAQESEESGEDAEAG